ncbi:MAG: PAS domain S-box protein, partial [Chloroflexi bacterium]|nr:PAS domain S-box protein [Chloroflexota bacterium]
LDVVCRELALAFNITRATAGLFNETKTEIRVVAEYLTQNGPSLLNSSIPVSASPLSQLLLTHQAPVVAPNVQADSRLARIHDFLQERDTVSLMILPLTVDGQVVGGLGLESDRSHHFSSEEVSLAWNVADQVAGVLARATLTQMRQRLSAAIEQTAESIIITDTSGLITYVNPAFERTSGYSRSEVMGQNPRILKSGSGDADFYHQLWSTISAGQVWHGRFVNKKKDGILYTAEATITPVLGENDEIVNYVGILRDVTSQLQLEEQLRQSKKVEAIGRLAGGIAHDFNNLLTVINGYSELLLARHLDLPDWTHQELEQIKKAGQRATALTQQLLAFSRKQPLEPRILNLNTVVTNAHQLLNRLIGEDLELSLNLEPNLAQITADPGQLEQIIINLAVNARDAMPQGGELVIETDNVVLDETYTHQRPGVTPGLYVLLAVSDTGMGMDQEMLAHIFEPFFTTKEQGKGTGLGLAIVQSIVKQNNGHIQVESEPKRGTKFKIFLPQVKALAELMPPDITPTPLPRGSETILVVEDEVSVREIICNILEANGYTVLQAASGSEAIQLCNEQQPEPLHLLFTDVVMLGLNGEELAAQLAQMYPHLKVLYTSGYGSSYPRSVLIQHNLLEPSSNFLKKPFTPDALLRKVRETLDRGSAGNGACLPNTLAPTLLTKN